MFILSFGAFYHAAVASIYIPQSSGFFSPTKQINKRTHTNLFTKTRQKPAQTFTFSMTAMMNIFRIYSTNFLAYAAQFTIIFDGTMDQHTYLQHIQTAEGFCFTQTHSFSLLLHFSFALLNTPFQFSFNVSLPRCSSTHMSFGEWSASGKVERRKNIAFIIDSFFFLFASLNIYMDYREKEQMNLWHLKTMQWLHQHTHTA